MHSRLASPSFIGYVLLQCSRTNGQFFVRNSSTTASISSSVAMPVDMNVFLFSAAMSSSNGQLPSIADATLLYRQSNWRRNSCDSVSHADANHSIPSDLQ